MGKIFKPYKKNTKMWTKVIKEHSVKKPTTKIPLKRLMMLRRRLAALMDEKHSWEEKNRNLLDNLNREKMLTASLKKEAFDWKRLYHEASISANTYKVKQAEMIQTMSICLKEIDSIYPHMVAFSESITSNKIRISNTLQSVHSIGNDGYLPRHFEDCGKEVTDSTKKCEKRMKHKVGPMVKGVLIQKPMIRLERIQQPQDQEPGSNENSPTGANNLTPIPEEDEQEELRMRHISMRQKHRLGSGKTWRMRRQEKLDKDRQRERGSSNKSTSMVDEDSSDSEDQLEPVMRLRDVSILLDNLNLIEVDSARGKEGNSVNRPTETETHHLRTSENPLEGCSWMHLNTVHKKSNSSPRNGELQSSNYKSDSSDEDTDMVETVTRKSVCKQLSDTLHKNKTFTMSRNQSSSSLSGDNSLETSDISRPEPDSTNNVDEQIVGSPPSNDTLNAAEISNLNSSEPAQDQLEPKTSVERAVNKSHSQRNSLTKSNSPIIQLPKVSDVRLSKGSLSKKRSSFCNNCSPSKNPELPTKRIRKPKSHLYPGEETRESTSKGNKLSIKYNTKKSVTDNKLSKEKKSLNKRNPAERKSLKEILTCRPSSSPHSANSRATETFERPSVEELPSSNTNRNRVSSGPPSQKKRESNTTKKRTSEKEFPSNNTSRNRISPGSSSQKKKRGSNITKKSVNVKKSLYTPNSSIVESNQQNQGSGENSRMRRNRGCISYKESPINVKMRRP